MASGTQRQSRFEFSLTETLAACVITRSNRSADRWCGSLRDGLAAAKDGHHFGHHSAENAGVSRNDSRIPNPGVARSNRAGGARISHEFIDLFGSMPTGCEEIEGPLIWVNFGSSIGGVKSTIATVAARISSLLACQREWIERRVAGRMC